MKSLIKFLEIRGISLWLDSCSIFVGIPLVFENNAHALSFFEREVKYILDPVY